MSDITLFHARKIITMDPNCPVATHVAVRDGRILAVGGADCADAWGGTLRHDDSLADGVVLPGFVEGHAHLAAGGIWDYTYAGYHDREDPDGHHWPGLPTLDAVIARLDHAQSGLAADAPLIAWGFDPIFLPSERLSRHHLDRISTERPIAVLFSNFHLMCVNSAALALVGYDEGTNVDGVTKGADGAPTGELQEMAAMFPVMRRLGFDFRHIGQRESAIRAYGNCARRAGVTTATDLYSAMADDDLGTMLDVTGDVGFPIRLVPALGATGGRPDDVAARAKALSARSTDKLRLGAVKLMTDGSIQGWTARVKWPGYVGGQPNGLWNTAPEETFALCEAMQRERVQMHIHVNGDEAAEVAVDAIEAASARHPWRGHRHVLQHCQMMTPDQFRRCAELGIAVNLFANHLWYFGDQHVALTIGPDRARRMNAARSALAAGLVTALHSDAPVTPMGPLFTAWCAVNRQTMSGQTLGPDQQLSVDQALYAITLGAAQTLKMDAEIGSIATGKRADFVLLGDDPTAVGPQGLRDIQVRATVLGGTVFSV